MDDGWLRKHREIQETMEEVMVDVQELHRLQRANQSTTRIATQIDRETSRLDTLLETLTRTLASMQLSSTVRTEREKLIANSANQLERIRTSATGKNNVLGLTGSRGSAPKQIAHPEAGNMLMEQQEVIKQQDVSLDMLLASVTRQKEMGEAISDELDQQSGLLDDLEDGMSNTQVSVNRQQTRVENFLEQVKSSGNTCLILGLSALLLILTMLALDMI